MVVVDVSPTGGDHRVVAGWRARMVESRDLRRAVGEAAREALVELRAAAASVEAVIALAGERDRLAGEVACGD